MKKALVSLTLIGLLIVPALILAQVEIAPGVVEAKEYEVCCGPNSIIYRLMNYLFSILLIVAAIFIIIAAFMFVTASGDPDKTKTARNFVLYALIGVLVAFGAKGLVSLVGTIAGTPTTGGWF